MDSFSIKITSSLSSFTVGVKKPYLLRAPLTGWGRADIRTSSYNNAGADGGLVTDQYYGMRQIPINLELVADTCEQHDQLRVEIENALPIREDVQVELRTPTNKVYVTSARVIAVEPTILNDRRTSYAIELRSGDPLLYDYTAGRALEMDLEKAFSGGFTLPATLPIVFAPGSRPSVVNNTGTVPAKPTITLTGTAINPIITNTTTNEFIKLNLTMVEGDVVVINTVNKTVTLNGGNIRNTVDPLSVFWHLRPGLNFLSLETQSQTDTAIANVKWFNGYLSI